MHSIRFATGRRHRNAAVLTALMTAAAVGVVAPSPAHGGVTSIPTPSHQQCVITASGGATAQRCFATAAEAIAFGTGGQIRLDQHATTRDGLVALRAHDVAGARGLTAHATTTAQTSNIIGIEYDGSYRSGAAKYFSVTGDCYSSATYGFPRLSTYGWNDRINSARTFVGCVGQHYDDTYYSDTVVSVFGSRDDFGGQNNKTSSIKFI